ncbi:Hypothetical_protein [Hexamita inflata]|uniref:Hypothetical_protein n=1 Tax=Hexamita inflata TaxID=28002 RepID=A0ABP1HRL4_9EUKA
MSYICCWYGCRASCSTSGSSGQFKALGSFSVFSRAFPALQASISLLRCSDQNLLAAYQSTWSFERFFISCRSLSSWPSVFLERAFLSAGSGADQVLIMRSVRGFPYRILFGSVFIGENLQAAGAMKIMGQVLLFWLESEVGSTLRFPQRIEVLVLNVTTCCLACL